MNLDPTADPWATAMLGAATLWLLSFLILMAALVARTERRVSGGLMLVSLLAFLGFAAAGTRERIVEADRLAALPPSPTPRPIVAETPTPDPDGARASADDTAGDSTGGPDDTGSSGVGEGVDGATTTGPEASSTGSEPDAETTGGAPDDGGEPEPEPEPGPEPEPEPAPELAMNLPEVEPLPTDPDDRKWAEIAIQRDAAAVASSPRRCARLDAVAQAWAELQRVESTRRSRGIARDLETCRRKLLYSISRRHRRAQVDARDEFADGLAETLRTQEGGMFWVSISGTSHERLRIGASELPEAAAEALMAGGLRADLRRLAFAHVVLTDGKHTKTYAFEVTPDGELGLPDLRAVGLGEPLDLPRE